MFRVTPLGSTVFPVGVDTQIVDVADAALPAALHAAVHYVHTYGRSVVLGIGEDGAPHLYRHQKEAMRHQHRALFRVFASRRIARPVVLRRRVPLSPLLGRE
jgi:hypothetical protein